MAIKIKDAGSVLQTATSLEVMDGTTLRTIRTVKVMDATATLRTVATFASAVPFTASASPTSIATYRSSTDAITITSNAATVTPAGGVSPFTYSWAIVSGDGTPTDAVMATTTFRAVVNPGETKIGTVRCTVTDAAGQSATAEVDLSFSNLDIGSF